MELPVKARLVQLTFRGGKNPSEGSITLPIKGWLEYSWG